MRYCSIDFETTGLDLYKDEPIQVGIVLFDEHFEHVRTFCSFIKINQDIHDLKDVVQLLTGITKQDIVNAPSLQNVATEIADFFGEDVLLIGHNIGFDEAFLKKLGSFPYQNSIDTQLFAQCFMHYAPSYALETLIQQKMSDTAFVALYDKIMSHIYDSETNSTPQKTHDALYDATLAMILFAWCRTQQLSLHQKYTSYIDPLVQSCHDEHVLLPQNTANNTTTQDSIKKRIFPLMQKPLSSEQKVTHRPTPDQTNENETLHTILETILAPSIGQPTKKDIGHVSHRSLLQELILDSGSYILAFSHPSKLSIFKNTLAELGYNDVGFLKEEQTIDEQKLGIFCQKYSHSFEEILFTYQYFSQLEQGYSVLATPNKHSSQIVSFLTTDRQIQPKRLILASHSGLYAMCEDDQKRETFASHHILFLDTERWYISCNKYLHFVFDPYYLLDTLESVLYTYNTMATTASSYAIQAVNVQAFYNQFQIFVGVFCLEAMAYARILKKSTYDIADLNNHSAFYKTQKSRDHLRHLFKPLSKEPHLAFLLQKLQKTSALMDQNITIDTKLLHHTHISFTLSHQTKFTDWSEFLGFFEKNTVTFLSTNGANKSTHNQDTQNIYMGDPRKHTHSHTLLSSHKNIFVLSANKSLSHSIVKTLHTSYPTHECMGENITGGVRKLVAKSRTSNKKIYVGGYHFLMALLAADWKYDICFVAYISGPLEKTIINDIAWYG